MSHSFVMFNVIVITWPYVSSRVNKVSIEEKKKKGRYKLACLYFFRLRSANIAV